MVKGLFLDGLGVVWRAVRPTDDTNDGAVLGKRRRNKLNYPIARRYS